MTTSEGEVVPERMRFERSSNNSRAKAQEALEYLLAGNERFRKVLDAFVGPWQSPAMEHYGMTPSGSCRARWKGATWPGRRSLPR